MSDLPELRFAPIEEFAAVKEPGAEPLARAAVGGTLIPARGKVLVFGDGGAGKTTLVLDLCFALAAGEPWLGLVDVDRPLRIAWIENEGPRQEFRDKQEAKLAATGARLDGRIVFLEEPWGEFTFAEESYRRALALELTEREIDLLVFGPVATSGMVGGGTPDEIRAFDALLDDVLRLVERPFAIVAIHHENRAGQVSGAWERVPDTLVHVTAQGHGRTRVLWKKARWASALHGTTTHLLWGDGETYTLAETRPEVTADTIAEQLLAAARANGGLTWTKLRDRKVDGERLIHGTGEQIAAVRDRLLADGSLTNAATVDGRYILWAADDPAAPRSDARTDSERLPFAPAPDEADPDPFAVRPVRGERTSERNGTTEPQTDDEDEIERLARIAREAGA